MVIRDFETSDLTAVFELLVGNGWSHRISSLEHLSRLLTDSQRSCVALDRGIVIGFARAITDGLSNGYLSMVVIAESHRRLGVGRKLVERIIDSGPGVTWVLRAGREGAREFFGALGFSPSTDAMERVRR